MTIIPRVLEASGERTDLVDSPSHCELIDHVDAADPGRLGAGHDPIVQDKLQLALDASETGLWTWDMATDVVTWTDWCYRILDRPLGTPAPSGQEFFAMVHPDDVARVSEAVQQAIAKRLVFSCEFRLLLTNGQLRWVANQGRGIYDRASGQPLQMLGTVRDITGAKEMEQSLRDAVRQKDEFLAMLSHELRGPLSPVCTGVELIKKMDDPQDKARILEMMGRQLVHLVRLIDDLGDAARVAQGKIELRVQPVNVHDLVAQAIEASRTLLEAKAHEIHVQMDLESKILGDKVRLAQVLTNLVTNAAKYTPEGGRIGISCLHEGAHVRIKVCDNGIGMTEEALSTVFELFAQEVTARKHAQGGLGIGLALAKKLVELHGGRVYASSAGLGQGSCFHVVLPCDGPCGGAAQVAPGKG